MSVTEIKSLGDFRKIINNENRDKDEVSVIDFWASWCGPCRTISPIFQGLSDPKVQAAKYAGSGIDFSKVKFYKVDTDEQPEIATEVEIAALPTFIAYKNGEQVDMFKGAVPTSLVALLKKVSNPE